MKGQTQSREERNASHGSLCARSHIRPWGRGQGGAKRMTDTLTGCQDCGARTPKCLLGCRGVTTGTCQPGASASTTSDQWGHAVQLWGSRVQTQTDPVSLPCQQTHSPPRSYTHFIKGPPQATLPTHNERKSSGSAVGSARLHFTDSRTFGTQRPHEYEKTFAASFFWVWSSFAPHLLLKKVSLCFLRYMRIEGGHIFLYCLCSQRIQSLRGDHKKEYSGFFFSPSNNIFNTIFWPS